MLSQFNDHCNLNELLPTHQSPYRAFHSCETSLLNICNDVLWCMENTKVTVLVVMDLSAVFDMVDHQIILDILKSRFGIKETTLTYFLSYLEECQFYVSIHNHHSGLRTLPCGVPQGSCAGPIALTAYSSTLETVVHKIQKNDDGGCADSISLNGFVDDNSFNKAFCPDTNEAELNTTGVLEHSLHGINHWMTMDCLKMNPTKTDFIYPGARVQVGKCLEKTINVCGDNIDCSDVIKLLGAHIDQHLSFKHHIGVKCKTAITAC